jgi:hypothetical protein
MNMNAKNVACGLIDDSQCLNNRWWNAPNAEERFIG